MTAIRRPLVPEDRARPVRREKFSSVTKEADAITKLNARIATLYARVRDVRAVHWPNVAHLPSMERPDDFVAELLDHVNRAEANPGR